MLPAIISQLVVTLKDTSLGFIILYPELLQTARLIASNTQVNGQYPYVSTIVVIGTICIAMCLLLSALRDVDREARPPGQDRHQSGARRQTADIPTAEDIPGPREGGAGAQARPSMVRLGPE